MPHQASLPQLPHISEAVPLAESDAALIADLRAVLIKYGALSRFGISLLHHHFEVSPDEVLVESTDEPSRTQTIQPKKKRDIEKEPFTVTTWRLDATEPVMVCTCIDSGSGHQHHNRPSDMALKEGIAAISDALPKLVMLNPVTYRYSETFLELLPRGVQLGLVAQEVVEVYPELVSRRTMTDSDGRSTNYLSLDYVGLIPVLVQAIKEQQQQITELRCEMDSVASARHQ